MTPLETLANIGKFFGYCAMALFLFLSVIGQTLFWFRSFKQSINSWPKQHKLLVRAAGWECWILGGAGALYVSVAVVAALWRLIADVW